MQIIRRIKPLKDVGKAIEIYYKNPELKTCHIVELFGVSLPTANRYLNVIIANMREQGLMNNGLHAVNTEFAYKQFGLDINKLEKSYKKLQEYGLI